MLEILDKFGVHFTYLLVLLVLSFLHCFRHKRLKDKLDAFLLEGRERDLRLSILETRLEERSLYHLRSIEEKNPSPSIFSGKKRGRPKKLSVQ